MSREFRILHHRQSGVDGGHWDLTENPIPFRANAERVPHGDGSLCAALNTLAGDGWIPVMVLNESIKQSGETFLLLARDSR